MPVSSLVKCLMVAVSCLSGQCQEMKPYCVLTPLQVANTGSASVEQVLSQMLGKISSNGTIRIIPTDSEKDFGTVVKFVSDIYYEYASISCQVIGVVGDLDFKTVSILHTLAERTNMNITLVSALAPSTFTPTTNLEFPNLIQINPLDNYVQALAAFVDHLNWTRIGLVIDDTDYYQFAAEMIQKKLLENPHRIIAPLVRITKGENAAKVIKTFKDFETDVVVVSTNEELACSLMYEANKTGFTWPNYAWIIFDVSVCSISNTCPAGEVIFLRDTSISEKYTEHLVSSCSILAFLSSVLTANGNFILSKNGTENFREGKIISITLGLGEELATFDTKFQVLKINSSFSSADKPRGTILRKHFNDNGYVLHVTLVMIMVLFLFSFITIILILYIYFRMEPEIKATSVSVSLSMFLCCYMLIFHAPFHAADLPSNYSCYLLLWFSVAGIPIPLITATIIVKMLRVYLIFTNPLSYKKKLFADPCLFLFIAVLVLPFLCILVIWSTYDPFLLTEQESPKVNYVLVYNQCHSDHTIVWLGSLFLVYFVLCLALFFFALKTSKIRYKHFKDTKATNAFAFLTVFILILGLIYWYFLRLVEASVTTIHVSNVVVYTTHAGIALCCQILLFVPKVYPPVKRHLSSCKLCGKFVLL